MALEPYKRLFDILFSIAALIFFLPLLLFVALLIKCTSRGPIFYRSTRVGLKGETIRCIKLRTMHLNADRIIGEILVKNPEMRKEWQIYSKLKRDPRVTPLGKWLRKLSIDEMPQFWNVLKGDLSLVGPRPYLFDEIKNSVGLRAHKILSVRPGLTGLWQTSGRSNLSFEERVRLEEEYIDRRSFRLDLLLICKTIPLIFFPKGAY